MTNDYVLFADPADGGAAIDPDIALIAAYLARELSPVQVAAVERRLATDAAFARAVQPVIDAWAVALPDRPRLPGPAVADVESRLTHQDIEQGWTRHVRAVRMRRQGAQWRRARAAAKVAAVVTLVALPVLGIAQMVARFVRHEPGGAGVRSGTPAATANDPAGRVTLPGTPALRVDSNEGRRGVALTPSARAREEASRAQTVQPSLRMLPVSEALVTTTSYRTEGIRVSASGFVAALAGGIGPRGMEQVIHVLAPNGDPVATVGNGAPDSLRLSLMSDEMGMGWVGDSLWVTSLSGVKLVRVSPAPAVIRTIPLPERVPGPPGIPPLRLTSRTALVDVYPDGGLLIGQPIPFGDFNQGLGLLARELEESFLYIRTTADGRFAGYVPTAVRHSNFGMCERRLEFPRTPPNPRLGNRRVLVIVPYCTPGTTSMPSPDGRWSVFASASTSDSTSVILRVEQLAIGGGGGGDTVFSRQYRVPGVAMTAQLADSGRRFAMDQSRNGLAAVMQPGDSAAVDSLIRANMPQNVQPVRGVLVGADGTVFVELYWPTPHRWLVISASGEALGIAVIPPKVTLRQVSRNAAWGLGPDHSIVRFRIGP